VSQEFARSHTHKRFGHEARKAQHATSVFALPSKVASQPGFLRSFVVAASGHGFHSADRLERADALQVFVSPCCILLLSLHVLISFSGFVFSNRSR
jgi:hypothetical protein